MSALKNPRQEGLAHALAAGKTQAIACAEAGYKSQDRAANARASNHPDVLVRKAEILRERHEIERRAVDQAVDKAAITKEWIVTRAKYIVDRAIRGTKAVYGEGGVVTSWMPSRGDDTAAIKGLTLLAHMGGYMIERI